MSYALQYDLQSIKIVKNPRVKKRLHSGMIIFVIVFGCLAGHIISIALQKTLLKPSENTALAAERMVESIRNGTSIGDAVDVFCQDVLQ